MKTITVVTKHPEVVKDYLQFGAHEVERGTSKFGDTVIIVEAPEEHADYNAARLGSGMHGARVMQNDEEFIKWKAEWGYLPS